MTDDGEDRGPFASVSESSTRKRRGGPNMVRGGPSLNPKGRPSVGLSLANAIRRGVTLEDLVAKAVELTHSKDEKIRLAAIRLLMERGFGKLLLAPVASSEKP